MVFTGTEMKLNISIDPIDGYSMEDYNFSIEVFTSVSRSLKVGKKDAIKVDKDNYVVLVDTQAIGQGRVKCKIVAYIPDNDFADGLRTEVTIVDTMIDVAKNL